MMDKKLVVLGAMALVLAGCGHVSQEVMNDSKEEMQKNDTMVQEEVMNDKMDIEEEMMDKEMDDDMSDDIEKDMSDEMKDDMKDDMSDNNMKDNDEEKMDDDMTDEMEKEEVMTDETKSDTMETRPAGDDSADDMGPAGEVKAGMYQEYSALTRDSALASGKKVVLFFHSKVCGSCRLLDSNIKKDLAMIPSDVVILKVAFDTDKQTRGEYDVSTYHTLVYLDANGKETKRVRGTSFTIKDITAEL